MECTCFISAPCLFCTDWVLETLQSIKEDHHLFSLIMGEFDLFKEWLWENFNDLKELDNEYLVNEYLNT